jgi:hypothetical protein
MQFAIEFFAGGSEGRRDVLERVTISLESVDTAEAFAVTIAKYIRISDRVADQCVIRDKRGRALREVRLTPPSDISPAVRANPLDTAAHKFLH